MNKKIITHPSINHQDDIKTICAPLQKLGITYFGHAKTDQSGNFTAITNSATYFQYYLERKYYNADLHTAGTKRFGPYVIWDAIKRSGTSEKMDTEAGAFGVKHTFTIVEQDGNHNNFYHFATDVTNPSINQIYMNNLDLLKIFILYFNETIQNSKVLRSAYEVKFRVDDNAPGYTIENSEILNKKLSSSSFLDLDNKKSPLQFISSLSIRELQILKYLSHGKNIDQIAQECHLAVVTVNKYISQLKLKTGAKSLFQLGGYYAHLLYRMGDHAAEMKFSE